MAWPLASGQALCLVGSPPAVAATLLGILAASGPPCGPAEEAAAVAGAAAPASAGRQRWDPQPDAADGRGHSDQVLCLAGAPPDVVATLQGIFAAGGPLLYTTPIPYSLSFLFFRFHSKI